MVWYGMVRYGIIVHYGMVCYGKVYYDMVVMAWFIMKWYVVACRLYDISWYCPVLPPEPILGDVEVVLAELPGGPGQGGPHPPGTHLAQAPPTSSALRPP